MANKIPLLNLRRSVMEIEEEVFKGWQEVLGEMHILNGKNLLAFEQEWAQYLGIRYAYGCSCGTSALWMAMLACGIGRGDEVILQANAFIADIEAIYHAGAAPVLVDVNPEDFGPDLEDVTAKLSPKTKALLLVHMYGHPCNMDEILELCNRHNLILIEDASHAHGAQYRDKKVGTFGRVGCFSCGPVKNLNAIGDAGALVTYDESLAHKLRYLRVHCQVEKNHAYGAGFNSRLDELQAVVLRARLKSLDAKNERRREIARLYHQRLSMVSEISLPPLDGQEKRSVYHRYMIGTRDSRRLMPFLKERGIEVGRYYPIPLHKQRIYTDTYGNGLSLPVSERLAEDLIAIPLYPELTQEEIGQVCLAIEEFFNPKTAINHRGHRETI